MTFLSKGTDVLGFVTPFAARRRPTGWPDLFFWACSS